MSVRTLTDEQVEDIEKKLLDRLEAARNLPVKELKRLWGVSEATVRRLIDAGEVPHTRVGNRVGVMQADAIAYLLRNRHAGGEQQS